MERRIYEFSGDFNLPSRIGLRPAGYYDGLSPPDLTYRKELLGKVGEVKIWRAESCAEHVAKFPDMKFSVDRPKWPVPDIFSVQGYPLVSEAARDAIVDADEDKAMHEFVPCLMFGPSGQAVTEQPYFHWWMRRVVNGIDSSPRTDRVKQAMARPKYGYLAADPALPRVLVDLPVFGIMSNYDPFFFSEHFLASLRGKALTGIDVYEKDHDRYYAHDGSHTLHKTVGHIEFLDLP